MTGRVIQYVDHIATHEQRDSQLVFAGRVGEKIGDGPDGLPLPSALTGVYDNENGTSKTDAREYPN